MRWILWSIGGFGASACSGQVDASRGAIQSNTFDSGREDGGGQGVGGAGGSAGHAGGVSSPHGDSGALHTGGTSAQPDAMTSPGGSATGGQTGTDAATGPDAASRTPPAKCVAPCIWNAIAACGMPSPAACLEDKISLLGGPIDSVPTHLLRTTTCLPGTQWTSVNTPTLARTSHFTIANAGTQCFSLATNYSPSQYLTYSDAAGHSIAVQFGNIVVCAEGATMPMLLDLCTATRPCDPTSPDPSIFDALPSGATGFIVHPDDPDCAGWKPPYGALPCSSVTTGTCGGDAGP
jgi:hypothetical protein